MIDFDEEIKRFAPSLEVSQAEEDIYKNDLKDIADIVLQMTEETVQLLSQARGSGRILHVVQAP